MATTFYRSITVNNLEIFYREAGKPQAPVILLLHGFPSSSHMYRNLIPALAEDYRVIAPDYPGFGYSSKPSPDAFEYSFDNVAAVMEQFIQQMGLTRFHLYMQDYGGPIGFRIITRHPEWVGSLLIQNANAYTEGLGPVVQEIGRLQQSGDTAALAAAVDNMLSLEGMWALNLVGAKDPSRFSPDGWTFDAAVIDKPVQRALFANYGANFPAYPLWQDWMRQHQPPTLITWGKNDNIFPGEGATAYLRDLPNAELHLFDGGHFLLEEYNDEVAGLIKAFLKKGA
ncbi:alpha/beta fold hydrolase [Chitinophaga qingshengii]|uniref:Alpha/beta hydrolase n=1 Tax=Chitinophaga qingshengii TaxID=1569794 RepID=A0ABR7TUH8_9BACT|nr:alpha/beta hydrolase [Chitinophaga qingshengii]MBC9933268.1 alpha/beta hydrolase [Chitinophaga qingshengii]